MSTNGSLPASKPQYDITFPPFPPAPAGVTVVPFKDWQERGICMEPGPLDAEVDTLGIPTVIVSTKGHSDDVCKTNTKRKRMEQETKARKKQGMSTSRTWWQEWEDRESTRAAKGVNPYTSEYERLHAAAQDFTSGRAWPITFKSESGPRFIWNKLQAYLGIPEGAQAISKRSGGPTQEMSDDEEEEDEEADGDEPIEISNRQNANILTDSEIRSRAATSSALAKNEAKLEAFFKDPEASIRIFMSSYSRIQGFIWAQPNLEVIPRLVGFFIQFLLRNAVLPEIDRQLRSCLPIVAKGLTELIGVSAISKGLQSDKFCKAAERFWGEKRNAPYQATPANNEEEKVNTEGDPSPPEADPDANNNDTTEVSAWASSGVSSGWGAGTTGGWGSADAIDNAWGVVSEEADTEKAAKPDMSAWYDPPEEFFQFLGPTTLPLTHSTGIVTQAMFKVKSVVPPNNNTPPGAVQPDGSYEPSADGVEAELDRVFTKVILSPMLDWDEGTFEVYTKPTILGASRGAVVGDATGNGSSGDEKPSVKPYDPLTDDITLLVESPEAVSHLKEGMGIGGVWVQLVREGPPAPKKKKSKSKRSFNGYWYVEQVAIITPTFWLASKDI